MLLILGLYDQGLISHICENMGPIFFPNESEVNSIILFDRVLEDI